MSKVKAVLLSSFSTLLIASITFSIIYFKNNEKNTQALAVNTPSDVTNYSYIKSPESKKSKEEKNDIITNSRNNIITKTVEDVSPAIVGINVTEIRQYRSPLSSDPFFRYFFGDRIYQREIQGLGSGTIISHDGYIVTNDHVAGNGEKIIVTMTDGSQYDAKIVGTDMISDVCLLKIEANNLPYVKLGNSNALMIGEWLIALGNPFGLFAINDKPTVTVGVLSATGMNLGQVDRRHYINMMQTDAAINSGNSGGALVNSLGELVGMNTLIYTAQGSSGNVGVGFAIPVNKVKKVIDELKKNGSVDRDFWTGLRIQTIDEGIANYYGLKNARGVIITHVEKGSPAEAAELEAGDIVKSVDKFRINDDNTMISVLQEFRTNDNIKLQIIRDDKELNKTMKLEKR